MVSKFTYSIKFDLEINNDIPILTCMCDNRYEIKTELFGKSKCIFKCPYCNEKWHFGRNREEETVLLINTRINGIIALKKVKSDWKINHIYYSK